MGILLRTRPVLVCSNLVQMGRSSWVRLVMDTCSTVDTPLATNSLQISQSLDTSCSTSLQQHGLTPACTVCLSSYAMDTNGFSRGAGSAQRRTSAKWLRYCYWKDAFRAGLRV
ncbi:hypothetical protein NXS19_007809 [Fusarium pseudograminearum]|nr:hypothetical protein NXS19_007809 [Fusarium pseudograminearum]